MTKKMSTTKQVLKKKPIQSKQQNKLLIELELKSMTKGDKKNKNIKILNNVNIHNYWSNIFRRKFEMHEYFSEAAFGSQTDTKIEFRNLWEDPEYIKKYCSNTDEVEVVPPSESEIQARKKEYLSIDEKEKLEE